MVYICSGNTFVPLGNGPFLNSYFSTIAVNLEKGKWGERFPDVMRELYPGELYFCEVEDALVQMQKIRRLLQKLPAEKRVWDYFGDAYVEKLDAGNKDAKTCYAYFSLGKRNITEEIIARLEDALEKKQDVYILNKIEEQKQYVTSKKDAMYVQEKIESAGIYLTMLDEKYLALPYQKGGKAMSKQYRIMRERMEKANSKEEVQKVLADILEDIRYNTLY